MSWRVKLSIVLTFSLKFQNQKIVDFLMQNLPATKFKIHSSCICLILNIHSKIKVHLKFGWLYPDKKPLLFQKWWKNFQISVSTKCKRQDQNKSKIKLLQLLLETWIYFTENDKCMIPIVKKRNNQATKYCSFFNPSPLPSTYNWIKSIKNQVPTR